MAGLYFHWPFCLKKCSYCDFFTTYPAGALVNSYYSALLDELSRSEFNEKISSIYFGGGTPSLITIDQLNQLLDAVSLKFSVDSNPEVTLEANPENLDYQKLRGFHLAGISRLSLGVQSFSLTELQLLGRAHDKEQVVRTISDAREAGFTNITLDLIFGLPCQTRSEWQTNLELAVASGVEHLSLYCLSWEPGTVFHRKRAQGKLTSLSEGEEYAMFRLAQEFLPAHGFNQYEISNYAKQGYQSQHNLLYWQNQNYLGLGASAASYDGALRKCNVRSVRRYIKLINQPDLVSSAETLTQPQAMAETVFLALRTVAGLNKQKFLVRFEKDVAEVFAKVIPPLVKEGLLINTPDSLRIPINKLSLADAITREFL